MLGLRELINEELTRETELSVYLPDQEMSGLTEDDFPLITLDMESQDGVRTYNKEVVTQIVQVEVYVYGPKEEIIFNESIAKTFSKLGFLKVHESKLGKTHHWYKNYRFKANVRKTPAGDYLIS